MVCIWDSLTFKENRGLKQACRAQVKAFSGLRERSWSRSGWGSRVPSTELQPFSTAWPFLPWLANPAADLRLASCRRGMQRGPGLRGALAFCGRSLPYADNLAFARWPCLCLLPNTAKGWLILESPVRSAAVRAVFHSDTVAPAPTPAFCCGSPRLLSPTPSAQGSPSAVEGHPFLVAALGPRELLLPAQLFHRGRMRQWPFPHHNQHQLTQTGLLKYSDDI